MAKHTSVSPSDCASDSVSAPALHPRAQTQALNAALDCLVLSPHPIQRQVSSVSSPRSLRPRQLLHVRCALAHRDLSFLAGLPASLSAPCVSPPIAPLSGFPLQRNHSPAPSRLQRPKDLDLPTSPDFSAPKLPWPPPWVHGAHSGPPPGTLCPRAASSEGPPRTPDPTCALHPSQSPASAQPLLPSLGPTAVPPPQCTTVCVYLASSLVDLFPAHLPPPHPGVFTQIFRTWCKRETQVPSFKHQEIKRVAPCVCSGLPPGSQPVSAHHAWKEHILRPQTSSCSSTLDQWRHKAREQDKEPHQETPAQDPAL